MRLKRWRKVFVYLLFGILAMLLLVFLVLNLPFSQRFAVRQVNQALSSSSVPIHLDEIGKIMPGSVKIQGILIGSLETDTIIYVGELQADIRLLSLLKSHVMLKEIVLDGALVDLARKNGEEELNIAAAFQSGKKKNAVSIEKPSVKWKISIRKGALSNIHFRMQDSLGGIHIAQDASEIEIGSFRISLSERDIRCKSLALGEAKGLLNLTPRLIPAEKPGDLPWNMGFTKLAMDDVDFSFSNGSDSLKLYASIGEGTIRANKFDLLSRTADMKQLSFNNSLFSMQAGGASGKKKPEEEAGETPPQWSVRCEDLNLRNSEARLGPEAFESMEGIDIRVADIRLGMDEAGMKLRNLAFKMENGFSLRKMSGEIASDREETRIVMEIESENSRVGLEAYAESGFQDMLSAPGEISKATLDLEKSHLSLLDLSCFLEVLDSLDIYEALAPSPLDISAKLDMEASRLSLSGFSLSQGKNFLINLAGDIVNPFQFSDATGDLDLEISGLDQAWAEALAIGMGFPATLPDLAGLRIQGGISDSLHSPEFHATLQSKWGDLDLGGSFDFRKELFNLACSFQSIAMGDLLQNSDMGVFTGAGEIKGRGYAGDKLNASFYLQIDTIGFKSYNYRHTQLTGSISPGDYKLQMVANDPSLKGDVGVFLNLADSAMHLEVSGMVKVQLNELKLYEDTLSFETSLEASLSSGGEVLTSRLRAWDTRLSTPGDSAVVRELKAEFTSDSLSSAFLAESDFFHADLRLMTPHNELDSLRKGYQNYFASFREASHITAENRVSVLPEIVASGHMVHHELLDIFVQDTGLYFASLDFFVSKQEDQNSLKAAVQGDEMSIKMLEIGELNAMLTDSAGSLLLQLVADTTTIFSGPEHRWMLDVDFSNRSMLASLNLGNYQDMDVYKIDLAGRADSNRLVFGVPSQLLTLNGQQWQLEQSEVLSIDLSANRFLPELKMKKDSSTFYLSAERQDPFITYLLDMNQVELASLVRTDVFSGSPEGTFTGSVALTTDWGTKKSINTKLLVSDISFSEEEFSNIQMEGKLSLGDSAAYAIDLHARMDSIIIQVKGERDAVGDRQLDGVFSHFPLVTLDPFTDKLISNLEGSVSGKLNISSHGGSNRVSGELSIRDAGMKVNMLNSSFRIPDQAIQIADERMLFKDFTVLDTLSRPLTLDGFVDFSNPGKVMADLNISSTGLQVMSRDRRSSAPFSGNVYVDSRVSVKGPLPRPDISGRIKLAKGTEIFYQHMEDLRMTETERIVNFTDPGYSGEDYDESMLNRPNALMSSSVETIIEVDPSTKINFTLAKRMFDIFLDVKGGGNVRYNMQNERMTISGKYEIGEGTTLLKLLGWPNKTFNLAKGGFISWDGMIENPELSLSAENKVSTSYLNPIDNRSRKIDFYVILSLSGYLNDLDVLFTIRTPDQYVMSVINTLSPEEQMRQAISVLLFEAIDLPGISSSTDYMTQQVNQILSSQLNQLTKSTIKGVDISFGLDTYDQSAQDGNNAPTTSLSYDVSKSLMNNRAQIEVSGRFSDDNQQTGSSDHSLNNVSFEYQLDSAASKYLKVYNEHTYDDVFEGEVIKTGIGFSYRKRYRTFKDIWKRKR